MMPIEYGRLRAEMLGFLLANPKGRVNLAWNGDYSLLDYFLHSRGLGLDVKDEDNILRLFHELYHERIIDSGIGAGYTDHELSWPYYRLTDYGRAAIEQKEYTPYDPDGYLAKLKRDVPGIHPDAIRYLEESLGCIRANYLLAASVTLGCAAEKCLLELIEAFGNAIIDPGKKAEYERDTRSRMISRKYEALWKRLSPMTPPSLPEHLADDLHTILDRVFNVIRTTRNDAGHPSGRFIERETVHANLLLFPSFCRRIYGLIAHFTAT
jgi:hypothetical protein